jgi:Ca2+:H+ antiporter
MGKDMDLNFEIFMIVLLVLSIVVVGNFLRDGESNYLEGALLMVSPLLPSRQARANHDLR